MGFVIQSAASLVAIGLLVALAAWAKIARPCAPLDAASARQRFAEEFPEARPEAIWIAADGRGAVARAQDQALVLFQAGDAYVARSLAWAKAIAAQPEGDAVRIGFGEPGAPGARLKLGAGAAWPPLAGDAA